jgi:hypothetical protein
MTTTTIKIKDYTIEVTGTYIDAYGNGFHHEHIPAYWQITDIILDGECIEPEYLADLLSISEKDLHKLLEINLNTQDKLDWESSYNFI